MSDYRVINESRTILELPERTSLSADMYVSVAQRGTSTDGRVSIKNIADYAASNMLGIAGGAGSIFDQIAAKLADILSK